ncbi:MAG: response regulator transcription factor [Dehalococcoidia bacterium]
MERQSAGRVLIIEDEPSIVDFVSLGLRYEGFQISSAVNGPSGLKLALETRHDLVILDIMLPGMDGFEVCRQLRSRSDVPVLMLTAKDEVDDRVTGLNLGADDYLTKPFRFEELLARMRAVLRRHQPAATQPIYAADLVLDPAGRTVRRAGRELSLTTREFDLLSIFMRHPGQVLTRQVILERVWGYDFLGDTNVIEVYVHYLRQKLGEPNLLHAVRGVGYALRAPADG